MHYAIKISLGLLHYSVTKMGSWYFRNIAILAERNMKAKIRKAEWIDGQATELTCSMRMPRLFTSAIITSNCLDKVSVQVAQTGASRDNRLVHSRLRVRVRNTNSQSNAGRSRVARATFSLYFTLRHPISPQNLPLSMRDLNPV